MTRGAVGQAMANFTSVHQRLRPDRASRSPAPMSKSRAQSRTAHTSFGGFARSVRQRTIGRQTAFIPDLDIRRMGGPMIDNFVHLAISVSHLFAKMSP